MLPSFSFEWAQNQIKEKLSAVVGGSKKLRCHAFYWRFSRCACACPLSLSLFTSKVQLYSASSTAKAKKGANSNLQSLSHLKAWLLAAWGQEERSDIAIRLLASAVLSLLKPCRRGAHLKAVRTHKHNAERGQGWKPRESKSPLHASTHRRAPQLRTHTNLPNERSRKKRPLPSQQAATTAEAQREGSHRDSRGRGHDPIRGSERAAQAGALRGGAADLANRDA